MLLSRNRYIGYLRQDIANPIIVNSQNVLQFFVEFASPRPANVSDKYITCYATALEPFGFEDDPQGTDTERREFLYAWLMDRLLTFRVQNRGGYLTAVEVQTYDLDDKAELWQYEPVPVLNKRMVVGSLEDALAKGSPLRGFEMPDRSGDLPLIVVVNGFFRGLFDKVLVNGASVGLRAGTDGLGSVEAISDGVEIIDDEEIWFVEKVRFQHLVQELKASTTAGPGNAEPEPEARIASVQAPSVLPAVSKQTAVVEPVRTTPVALQSSKMAKERVQTMPELTEDQFLKRLQAHAHGQGLYFRTEDLLGFHTALKTGSLVVLSGLSGTGKSRLVEVYRQALGLSERSHFLWLSVRPNWNDDADLIGYYDPLNRLYRPGETGLLDVLMNAYKSPDEMFMVCLDEMNLARVEHYFSQFLSNMERPAGQRLLRLYAPELQPEVYNSHRYPPFIPIGPNVLFCGTINVDESTHSFSDKVLDRSNVIRMEYVDLQQWWQEMCQLEREQDGSAAAAESEPTPIQTMVLATTWRSWCAEFDPAPYGPQVELLQGINELLGSVGGDRQFGYRVVRQILLYLHRLPRNERGESLVDPGTALDQQVCQRILTKVRGSGAELRDLFKSPGGKLEAYLKKSDLSTFARSLGEVRRKYLELERHDFTS